ncbi:GrpB family protein [Chromobacterium alticapitis]|uniref:GrpB family protein n=1 Tax=Chromobacterium alticapitis TaxID=2073169 RepID=A0A2S5DL93_9NEIS|nr:GrpB family protein [Chromobacterium alticapitis]POZ63802.1 GrpB family protein [Chromobacterium alticapitis]
MANTIEIQPYHPAWPQRFATEAAKLRAALGTLADQAVIEHIGSTAVPGLAAKPVIDIMLGLPRLSDLEPYFPALSAIGFHHQPQMAAAMPERHYFTQPALPPRQLHLHAVALDSDFWRDKLWFRDALRADSPLSASYAALKQELAKRYGDDRAGYTDAKSGFINEALAAAKR